MHKTNAMLFFLTELKYSKIREKGTIDFTQTNTDLSKKTAT